MANIGMIGRAGSGKSKQSIFLQEAFNLAIFNTGEGLRNMIATKFPLEELTSKMDKGLLIDDDVVLDLVTQKLLFDHIQADCNIHEKIKRDLPSENKVTQWESIQRNGIIIDGFPRTTNQFLSYESMISNGQLNPLLHIDFFIYLEVPREVCISRILHGAGGNRQRTDDMDEEVVHARHNEFEKYTLPMIDYIQTNYPGRIFTIQQSGTKEETAAIIHNIAAPYFTKV